MSDTDTEKIDVVQWRQRIIGTGEENPQQLLANPKNWRIHPKHQQRALLAVLSRVGWVQDVIVNRESGFVLDGHLRVALAISEGEETMPVSYVDLTDAEEDLMLAGLDPLSEMAVADPEALNRILEADVSGELEGLFAPEDQGDYASEWETAYGDDFAAEPAEETGETVYVVMCPECGKEFSVAVPEE